MKLKLECTICKQQIQLWPFTVFGEANIVEFITDHERTHCISLEYTVRRDSNEVKPLVIMVYDMSN